MITNIVQTELNKQNYSKINKLCKFINGLKYSNDDFVNNILIMYNDFLCCMDKRIKNNAKIKITISSTTMIIQYNCVKRFI